VDFVAHPSSIIRRKRVLRNQKVETEVTAMGHRVLSHSSAHTPHHLSLTATSAESAPARRTLQLTRRFSVTQGTFSPALICSLLCWLGIDSGLYTSSSSAVSSYSSCFMLLCSGFWLPTIRRCYGKDVAQHRLFLKIFRCARVSSHFTLCLL
jgi:hypothetical protein